MSLVTAMLGSSRTAPEFQNRPPKRGARPSNQPQVSCHDEGWDGLALVRYGMRLEVMAPLLSALIVRLLFNDTSDPDNDIDVDRWCAVLGLDPLPANGDKHQISLQWFDEVLGSAIPPIYQWVANATLDDLVDLTPPGPGAQALLPS